MKLDNSPDVLCPIAILFVILRIGHSLAYTLTPAVVDHNDGGSYRNLAMLPLADPSCMQPCQLKSHLMEKSKASVNVSGSA